MTLVCVSVSKSPQHDTWHSSCSDCSRPNPMSPRHGIDVSFPRLSAVLKPQALTKQNVKGSRSQLAFLAEDPACGSTILRFDECFVRVRLLIASRTDRILSGIQCHTWGIDHKCTGDHVMFGRQYPQKGLRKERSITVRAQANNRPTITRKSLG